MKSRAFSAQSIGGNCTLGEVGLFIGNFAPINSAFANGQLLSVSQYPALFTLLGTIYGGNGVTTFALPDLRGLQPRGVNYLVCTQGYFPSRP